MSRYIIDDDIIGKSPLSTEDILVLLLLKHNIKFIDVLKDLEKRGYVVYFQGDYYVTPTSEDIIRDILLRAEKIDHTENLAKLAQKLVDIFPEGKKPGTSFMWRCSVKECAMRLREFEKMFGKHSHDDIEDATKRYVNSFAGDRTLMRTLKYFIWKQENTNGIPEFTSDLATWIENKDTIQRPSSPKRQELITL